MTLQVIQTVVLTATLAAIIWYTIETSWLRKEMVRQNRISLGPIVVPSLEIDGIHLKNVGEGCALNVNVSATVNDKDLAFEFEQLYYLAAAEKENAHLALLHLGQRQQNIVWHHWERLTNLTIHFEDVEGTKYRIPVAASLRMGKTYPGELNKPMFVIGAIETL